MLLHVLRVIFLLVVIGVAMAYITADVASGRFGDEATEVVMPRSREFFLGLCVLLGLAVIGVDLLIPRKVLGAISGLFFGLVVGMLAAYALSLVVDLFVQAYAPNMGAHTVTELVPVQVRDRGKPVVDDQGRPVTELVKQTIERKQAPLVGAVKLLIGVITCYLAVSFILQTKDDIRFVIPYVEFAKQTKGSRPLLLDTSVIIDGRVADICETGFIESRLVIPRFILQELQGIADSADRLKRNRGRRGLDMLNKLQTNEKTDIEVLDASGASRDGGESVDSRLVNLAAQMNGRVMTNDYNLNKICQLRGVDVININDLSNALKPVVLPGETLAVKIIKPGEEPGQGVGYLEDGTMVVVEQAREHINDMMTISVTSVLQTSAGRMIFGRPEGSPPIDRRRRGSHA